MTVDCILWFINYDLLQMAYCRTNHDDQMVFKPFQLLASLPNYQPLDIFLLLFSSPLKLPDKVMDNGSLEEVEIRGTSIFIVEELKKLVIADLEAKHPDVARTNVNSILLDHFLWDYRRRNAKALEHIPFHKTIGIYY